jgi:hypothetical protein
MALLQKRRTVTSCCSLGESPWTTLGRKLKLVWMWHALLTPRYVLFGGSYSRIVDSVVSARQHQISVAKAQLHSYSTTTYYRWENDTLFLFQYLATCFWAQRSTHKESLWIVRDIVVDSLLKRDIMVGCSLIRF